MVLFSRNLRYNEVGAASVNLYSQNYFLEKGEYSESLVSAPKSAVTNMYDNDATTVYFTLGGVTNASFLIWDFKRKVKFLNIYAIPVVDVGGGSTNTTKIWGSNNNVDWTELATVAQTATGTASCIATNIKYRYIKITQQKSAASGNMGLAAVIGVVR